MKSSETQAGYLRTTNSHAIALTLHIRRLLDNAVLRDVASRDVDARKPGARHVATFPTYTLRRSQGIGARLRAFSFIGLLECLCHKRLIGTVRPRVRLAGRAIRYRSIMAGTQPVYQLHQSVDQRNGWLFGKKDEGIS